MAKVNWFGLAGGIAVVLLIIVSILLVGIIVLVGALLLMSPGTPKPLVDEIGNSLPGSISEKVFVNINGVRQGMFIKGKDARNPVLLVLH